MIVAADYMVGVYFSKLVDTVLFISDCELFCV